MIFDPGPNIFKCPLHIGEKYSSTTRYRRALLGSNTGQQTWDMEVVGWEEVTVPGGTFRAMRLEGRGTIERFDQPEIFFSKYTLWYAPEVNRTVKSVITNANGRTNTEELVGYRLNK